MSNNKLLKGNIMEVSCLTDTPDHIHTMIRAIKKYVRHNFTILLVIDVGMNEFHSKIGQACSNQSDFMTKMSAVLQDEEDPLVYVLMGKMILNELIPTNYFIKCHTDKTVYEIQAVKEEK